MNWQAGYSEGANFQTDFQGLPSHPQSRYGYFFEAPPLIEMDKYDPLLDIL